MGGQQPRGRDDQGGGAVTTNDGGPAFPVENDSDKEYYWIHKGMTLRDYFAGKAATGILEGLDSGAAFRPVVIAENAYEVADAMIKAREAK